MLQATLPTLRSSWFSEHEKSVILVILPKGGTHENFWKAKFLEKLKVTYFV